MAIAIDPVCEMEVEMESAVATSDYEGQTYYFCAPGCKIAFDADPVRYLLRKNGAASTAIVDAQPTMSAAGLTITLPVDRAIRTRRSVARLKPDPVPREAIERMLEAAVWAPNHHLTEPWEFVVLSGEAKRLFAEIRRDFRRTLFKNPNAPAIQPALEKIYADTVRTPVIIAVSTTAPDDPALRDDDYAATMCAIHNMLLVATGLGLGTYLRTGGFIHHGPLLRFLGVPTSRRIAGIVYVGYPDHVPERRRTPATMKTRWMDSR